MTADEMLMSSVLPYRRTSDYLSKLFAVGTYRKILKTIVWYSFPNATLHYYRMKRLKYSSIVLLVHEGLGDLAAIAAAIDQLSREHREVHVVTRREFYNAISLIFGFGDNVRNIPAVEGKLKKYEISANRLAEFGKHGRVIKVGQYDFDPLFRYPNTFYIKLGCALTVARRKFRFPVSSYRSPDLDAFMKEVGGKFIFFSNETSTDFLTTSHLDGIDRETRIVAFSKDPSLRENERIHNISKLDKDDFTRSLLNSLYACSVAERIVVSDAGLFNILIRLESKFDVRVIWREHRHSLNRGIYGKFTRQEF